jgi:predicted small lipoprotein YifL
MPDRARFAPFLLAVLAAVPVAGCGQKGALVLPDRDTSDVVIRPAAGSATAATPERREPSAHAPAVPAPAQAPSETAPRSTTPR